MLQMTKSALMLLTADSPSNIKIDGSLQIKELLSAVLSHQSTRQAVVEQFDFVALQKVLDRDDHLNATASSF